MATFRSRNGKWQVQIRLKGSQPVARTFNNKSDARRWARHLEAEMQSGDFQSPSKEIKSLKFRDLIQRYLTIVSSKKLSCHNETIMLQAFMRQKFCNYLVQDLSPNQFAEYRDQRTGHVKAATINRELDTISHMFKLPKTEWGLPIVNPVDGVRRVPKDLPRTRRLRVGEWESLMHATNMCRNRFVRPVIQIAVETGMRRGEIVNIRCHDLCIETQTLSIPKTKTGQPRRIPLAMSAVQVLENLSPSADGRLMHITVESFKQAWSRLIKKAGITDLHFHDLRHEAISRFFEMGLSVPEVALISGHAASLKWVLAFLR
jgi:integrase